MVSSVVDVVDKRSTSYQATMALAENELYGAWDGDNGTTAYLMMANADNLREQCEALQDRAYSMDETTNTMINIVNTRSDDGRDDSDPMLGPSLFNATAAGAAAKVAAMTAPRTDREANVRPDSDQWATALVREYGALSANNIFTWLRKDSVPPRSKILTTRFVYNIKVDERISSRRINPDWLCEGGLKRVLVWSTTRSSLVLSNRLPYPWTVCR